MKFTYAVILIQLVCLFFLGLNFSYAQKSQIIGKVMDGLTPIPFANVYLEGTSIGTASDKNGNYQLQNIPIGTYLLKVTAMGYFTDSSKIIIIDNETIQKSIFLKISTQQLEETVVTGTLKAVSRSESPVPVEVYSPTFLKKNPTASIFEA